MIQTYQTKKCSNCKAENEYEYVDKINRRYIRCKKCGHEKLEFETTTGSTELTTTGTNSYGNYYIQYYDKEEF